MSLSHQWLSPIMPSKRC